MSDEEGLDISPLAQGLIGVFETFHAAMEAGFTEHQALVLVANIITANQQD